MKIRSQTAAALAFVGAAAQMSYITVTYESCSSVSMETMITVTMSETVNYCPTCTAKPKTTSTPTSIMTPGHTTIYTTIFSSLCSTGLVPVTHTITESCPEPTPTWTPGPSHIPDGYTVTVKTCSVGCGAKPAEVTITEKCDCVATSGTSMGPKPTATATVTPVGQISDGQGTFLASPRP